VPNGFVAQQLEYGSTGKPVAPAGEARAHGSLTTVTILAGGFTVVKLVRS
jgi:hypothetical protein